jgi:hypothetical protein
MCTPDKYCQILQCCSTISSRFEILNFVENSAPRNGVFSVSGREIVQGIFSKKSNEKALPGSRNSGRKAIIYTQRKKSLEDLITLLLHVKRTRHF